MTRMSTVRSRSWPQGLLGGAWTWLALGLLSASTTFAAGVTLAWDPSSSSNVAGYKVYYGVATGVYIQSQDDGAATNAVVTNLVAGSTYYFAAKAYDSTGLESLPSNEVSYNVPILPQVASLTWSNPTAITYGTPLGAPQLNATANVPGTFSYSPPAGTVLPAGNAQTLTVAFTPTDLVNYAPANASVTLSVLPAPLQISADNKAKPYGAALPLLTYRATGFVNGDTLASLTTPPTLATTASAATGVGAYPISVAGATSANYAISFVNGTLTVTPAILQITADNKSKTYGAALPLLTFTATGFVNGDTAATLTTPPTLTTTASAASAVGTYPISLSGGTSPNYTANYLNGTLTVTPATLQITADSKSKTYGAALPLLTYTATGFVNGDTAGSLTTPPTLTTTASAASAVGTYLISVSGGTSPNYTANYVNGTLTVTPATLQITADTKSKTYGAALPLLTYTATGFVNGDTAATLTIPPTLTTTASAASAVGTYPISVSGGTSPNYAVHFVAGSLTVTPATLQITADNKSKVYGTTLPPLTATVSGFVNGDTVATLRSPLTITTTASAASAVGTYPITVAPATVPNYTVQLAAGTLTVTPASLQIVANNQTMSAGAALPTLTATYTGFVNGDSTASLTTPVNLSTTATTNSPAGTYPIVAAGAATANYSITFVNGTLTITAAQLTGLTLAPSSLTLAPGQSLKLTATGTYSDGSTKDLSTSVSWTSSQPSKVTVDSTGLATGVKAGTCTVTAQSGSLSASIRASVVTASLRISFNSTQPLSQLSPIPSPSPRSLSPTAQVAPAGLAAAGSVTLTLQGVPGQTYVIQASPDLTHWEDLGTVTLTDQSLSFADQAAGQVPLRFYRAQAQP